MADYTFIILVTISYAFNYLMLYKKNRIFYNLLFIAISGTCLYLTSNSNQHIALIFYPLLVIGFISFIYDTFLSNSKSIAE